MAYLFGEQLFPPESEAPAVDPMVAKIAAKKKEREAAKKAAAAATGGETPVTEPISEGATEPTTPGETPTTDTTTEVPPVDMSSTTPDLTPTEPVVTEPTTTGPMDSENPTETPPIDTATQDTIDPETPNVSGTDENMTDKILEDLEKQVKESTPRAAVTTYVSPPDYEYRGRGLVYNCVGKHWACIDGPSYRVCEDNASGTKFLKKKNECYPFNVYQTQGGCEKVQNRMVSSGAKTNFCNE